MTCGTIDLQFHFPPSGHAELHAVELIGAVAEIAPGARHEAEFRRKYLVAAGDDLPVVVRVSLAQVHDAAVQERKVRGIESAFDALHDQAHRLRDDLRGIATACESIGDEADLRARAERAIRETVASSDGNLSLAARRLGISRNTLYRKLKTLGP